MRNGGIHSDDEVEVLYQTRGIREIAEVGAHPEKVRILGNRESLMVRQFSVQADEFRVGCEQRTNGVKIHVPFGIDGRTAAHSKPGEFWAPVEGLIARPVPG